jgi:hypothetical protein
MTEKNHPESPSNEGVICPFAALDETSQVIRRKDLLTLGSTFKDALLPMKSILEHMKGLNARWSAGNKQMRRLALFQLGVTLLSLSCLVILLIALKYAWASLTLMEQHTDKLGNLEKEFNAQTKQLSELENVAHNTEQKVQEVKEDQDTKPTLELVPETDPVKARRAPVKLRVTAPAKPAPLPKASMPVNEPEVSSKKAPPTMAEIPLSAESF